MPSEFERFRGSQDVGRRIAANDLADRGWVAGRSLFLVLMKLAKGMEISRIALDRRDRKGAGGNVENVNRDQMEIILRIYCEC
jgi:hypothetical protein